MDSIPKGPPTWRVVRSLWRASRTHTPRPAGDGTVDHAGLGPVLGAVAGSGLDGAVRTRPELARYRERLHSVEPDSLGRDEALAFWINLYNAEALEAAVDARERGLDSLLRDPDAFDRRRCRIAGEHLSLDEIEHGKVRRFRDPRAHAALVCASASCPSLPERPMSGPEVDQQLDSAMRDFLARSGAAVGPGPGELKLSRIFLWYGADFVYPRSMPRWRPVSRRSVARSLLPWLEGEARDRLSGRRLRVRYLPYDWHLGCHVAAQPPADSSLSAGTDTRITPRKSPTA